MIENDQSIEAIGKRLRYLRIMAGLSRNSLAEKANVGKTSISYWENGNSGLMTETSMNKLLDAIQEAGVCASTLWLRTGLGDPPKVISQNDPSDNKLSSNNHLKSKVKELSSNNTLDANLIKKMAEDIDSFQSFSHLAVIVKIDNSMMAPIFQKGDVVGGIWQDNFKLTTEKPCIVKYNNKLQVRWVKSSSEEGLYNISYLTFDPTHSEPFHVNDIPLQQLAPIIRVWRY